jgi:hypothetical protein
MKTLKFLDFTLIKTNNNFYRCDINKDYYIILNDYEFYISNTTANRDVIAYRTDGLASQQWLDAHADFLLEQVLDYIKEKNSFCDLISKLKASTEKYSILL